MRGLLRCSFYRDGQCEGLRTWSEQQASAPRFFYTLTVREGAGTNIVMNSLCT